MNEKMMESFMNSIQYTSTNTQTEQWLALFSTVFTQTNLIQCYIFFCSQRILRNQKVLFAAAAAATGWSTPRARPGHAAPAPLGSAQAVCFVA